jgi:tetratricopeptide (TPR) repeat protein
MKCSHCGHENPGERIACESCGLAVGASEEVTLVDPIPSPSQLSKTARSPVEAPTEYVPVRGSSVTSRGSATTGRSAARTGTGELMRNSTFHGRYQILDVLGEGGMGVVYKARDLELDKVIALKTIRTERETDPETVQRFKRELLLAREITHKNVVRIHDFNEADGIKYFTMEYIEGESLKERIRRQGRLTTGEALPIIRQILSALQEAHERGVIHRDLKPQNIMLDRNGVPHIMDFGIARSEMETTGLTATGMMIGTPDYMPPEQVKGEKADQQSDLFSLGVILYEALTGDLPFKAESPASRVMMRLSHRPRAPRQITLEIPKYLEQIVLKLMEVDRALRYRSAREVLDDIDRRHVDRSLTMRVQRAVSTRKPALAFAAVLVAAIAAAYYLVSRTPSETAGIAEGPKVSLAILPLTNAAGSTDLEWLRTGLPQMLVTDIAQSRYVKPIPGERVLKVMSELGVAENTRFDEGTLASIAGRAPADSLLYGQFVESGGEVRLDLTLRKSSSGVTIPLQFDMRASEVFALVDRITAEVKERLDLAPGALRADADRPVAEVSTGSLDALRAYQLGLDQFKRGSNQAAIEEFSKATAADPNFAMAYAKLAEAQFHLGEHNEAGASIDRAQRLAQAAELPLVERYQIHAVGALVKNEYETATRSLAELAALYPEDADIQLSLARSYEELGDLEKARPAYETVVELEPGYEAAVLGLGRIHVMSGDSRKAIDTLGPALAGGGFEGDDESLGMVHSILGVAHRELGELDVALTHLDLSLEARTRAGDHRGQATTLHNLAAIYEYKGEIDRALAAERKAIAIAREVGDREEESVALNNMGLTYQVAGRLDKALEAFRESLRIEMERQDHAEMASRLDKIANIYQLRGNYDDAVIYLEQAKQHLELADDKLEKSINQLYLGSVRKAQGLYPEATEAFLSALALARETGNKMAEGTIQKNVAEIYVAQGRYGDAYSALEQSLAIFNELHVEHDIAEAKAPLGHLLIRLGQIDAAEQQLREAEHVAHGAQASDLMPDVHLGRAEIHELLGRDEEAAAAYEEANVQANLSGKKEVAVMSRIELGRLFLRQDKIDNAERMLRRTKSEAAEARLRPLEAEAAAALADVALAKGEAEQARSAALEALGIAEKFTGRPILVKAYATLARALETLGRREEALDAHMRSAEALEWIRGSLRPEHVESFVARRDVQELVRQTVQALETAGRAGDAASLRKWLPEKKAGDE